MALFMACESDDLQLDSIELNGISSKTTEVKMVPFKGKFSSTPTSLETIECDDPDTGFSTPANIYSAVSGNATHLGKLDPTLSEIEVVDCSLDAIAQVVITTLDMTFINKKGHGIRVEGDVDLSIEGPTSGYFIITEGFGKFENASGWIATQGSFDITNGTTVYSADGYISQPNQR